MISEPQSFAYDVFLSHSAKDKAVVRDVAERLRKDGVKVWFDEWVLKPGDTFEYSSGSSIPTAVGTMRGSYQLVAEDGTRFEASIPEFTLSVPRTLH